LSVLQEQFITEARDLVREATGDLIALEREGASPARIDRVFRAFHTLKGSAGVVELPAMIVLLHAGEDLLASVRRGALGVSPEIIDSALACLDLVSRWVGDFETTAVLPEQAGEDGRAMAERLRAFLPAGEGQQAGLSARNAAASGGETALPEWASRLISLYRDTLASRMPQHLSAGFAISYEPIAGCFYNGDDPLELMRRLPGLLALHLEPREAFPQLADLDPYACNLRLLAFSAGDRDEISRIFRLVPDQVLIADIPREALSAVQTAVNDDKDRLIQTVIEAQCELLRVSNREKDFAGCVGAAALVAANALRHCEHQQAADTVNRAAKLALSQRDCGPLLVALEAALVGLAGAQSGAIAEAINGPAFTPASLTDPSADRVLRVSEGKIDDLVNLAGELVVAKNALAHSTKRVDQQLGGNDVAESIRRDNDVIERLVVELHRTILQLRMVPLARVFGSFPRLIRDLSRQLGKNVAVAMRGDTTEADKTVIDRLFEPLVHLVRNAVDHGVESPEQRRAGGKSETATVSIHASRSGDRLLVEVTDDGRGIDPAVVRRKASEKQLMTAAELAGLTDEQLVDLVFAAGFSTTAEITDISGRGIGMDVVRAAVEQLGGRVSLVSKVGVGTTARLDLPTTIAISRIMVVEAGGQRFGILMEAVSETVRVSSDRISRIKNNDGFVLRDRIVPIVSLAELMKLPKRARDQSAARLFVIVEALGRIAAFEIDSICDRIEVVLKPMQGLLTGARGYAGTTFMGDGQVLLVLDVKEILP
jgi:two-component system chemotaxis sensor kinase CheA